MNAAQRILAKSIIQTLAKPTVATGRKRRRKRRGKGIISSILGMAGLGRKKRRKRKVRL